jgi:predicted transposase YdaD
MRRPGYIAVDFNPFDVATKELVWEDPAAWLGRLGIATAGLLEIIDSEITTLTAAADKVIKVPDPQPYLVNIEFQSYHDIKLARTLWFRQAALDYRHDLSVLTVLVLLCKEANSPSLTGTYERNTPHGWQTNRYNYKVIRVWEDDPELYLAGGLGLVPLAPLADVSVPQLPDVIRRMEDRIDPQPPPRRLKFWTATYLLMGVRYEVELIDQLLERVEIMHQSTTYQKILREGREQGREQGREEGREQGREEGRIAEARRYLLILGSHRFGQPDQIIAGRLEGIRDIDRLEALGVRILEPGLASWDEFLQD